MVHSCHLYRFYEGVCRPRHRLAGRRSWDVWLSILPRGEHSDFPAQTTSLTIRLHPSSCSLLKIKHCTQLPNGSYSKDLTVLNEDLARICLVDNSPVSYNINKGA